MNGAESIVHTLLKSGVDTCFANPGTSEMHFVAALDRIPGMRCVLGLQENVVTGMADGFYRVAGRPACALLHCGPGLANGLANLHNARRAGSGVVAIVGDQATYHRPLDPPLTADTDGMARAVSHWVRTCGKAADAGRDVAAAVQAARTLPGQIATLILPSDASWSEGGVVAEPLAVPAAPQVDGLAMTGALRLLRDRRRVLLLLAGRGASPAAQAAAWRIGQATGAGVMIGFTNANLSRGRGRPPLERVPYVLDQAIAALAGFEHVVLVNAEAPVSFFAYPGKPSRQTSPQAQIHVLTRSDQDGEAALQTLADELGASDLALPDPGPRPAIAQGTPTAEGLAQTLAAVIPEGAVVVDESVSLGRDFYRGTRAAPAHDWLHLVGGAIGSGLPMATGAGLAGGGRRVIGLQADGSAMYSLQSLWTQAHEGLPVTTILLNNRKYAILLGEFRNVGATPGPTALSMLELGKPNLDWVGLANSLGVEAAQATTLEACADLLTQSFRQSGPFLIDLVI
jgi:acetolactate synthase-1/2/3 large subunit